MVVTQYLKPIFMLLPLFICQHSIVYGQEWKTFEDNKHGYSIRYSDSWHVYTKDEITATHVAGGGKGEPPTFAVQSPDRSSFYIVTENVRPQPAQLTKGEQERYLRRIYIGFAGKDLATLGWTRISEKFVKVAGLPAIECIWRMPEMYGTVLINKHWCFSTGTRGIFLGSTANERQFDNIDKRYFTPMVLSLQILGASEETSVDERLSKQRKLSSSLKMGRIAFRSERDGNWEIYVMNLDATGIRRLTNNIARDDMPRWSPDGKQIIFRSERDGNQEIYIMNSDGSSQRRLTNNYAKDSEPSFAPDGSRILFSSKRTGEWELYTMNIDGTDQKRSSTEDLKGGGGRFSPDGKKIVFSSMRDGDPEIYLMDSDGRNVKRLTRSQGYDGGPVFSPSVAKIAFMSSRDGNMEIYTVNVDGSGAKNVTNHLMNDGGPVFLDDDNLIFFSDRNGDVEIYRLNFSTNHIIRVTNNPGYDGMIDVWLP